MADIQSTTLNRGWATKMAIIAVVLLGFGLWGLYDAMILYPARGKADASYKQKIYLERAQAGGTLLASGFADPATALEGLESRVADLEKAHQRAVAAESAGNRGELVSLAPLLTDYAALHWLRAEKLVGGLKPENTKPAEPLAKLNELRTTWEKTSQPKPLSAFDIPLQWVFTAIGIGGAAWMVLVIVRASRVKYRYEPESQTLHLPDGRTVRPADVREFDKRKWHKFFVTLTLTDGRSEKLDLLRNVGLEDWVLAMEKTAFPEADAPADAEQAAAEAPASGGAAT